MILPTLDLEKKLWDQGIKIVVGIDEAGRGPLAGPVVAGAVVVRGEGDLVEGVRDSKKISKKKRESLYQLIIDNSWAYGVGVSEASVIDELGIQVAVRMAMVSALTQVEEKLKAKGEYLIVDGKGVLMIDGYPMQKITKGDLNHYSIAAASILAKVKRDEIMSEYSKKFPEYGFEKHVGYGTKGHIEAILKYGISDIHRKSFQPISSILLKM